MNAKKFCRVVNVERRSSITGTPTWILTHECGDTETRTRRKITRTTFAEPPVRVKCARPLPEGGAR
jgi:hypothetical protein